MTLGEVLVEVHTIVSKLGKCGGFCFSARQMYAELVSTLGISLSQFGAQKRTYGRRSKKGAHKSGGARLGWERFVRFLTLLSSLLPSFLDPRFPSFTGALPKIIISPFRFSACAQPLLCEGGRRRAGKKGAVHLFLFL